MISKAPLNPKRLRRITGSFSWIDHRLLHDGFLAAMAPEEMLLYFFLVLVGDRNGISFYSYDKICALLKLEVESFIRARDQLVQKALLAYHDGRYQVLQLPARVPPSPAETPRERTRQGDFNALASILQQLKS